MAVSNDTGAVIHQLVPGSPAESAGFKKGDLLLSINGAPIRDVIDYQFHCYGGLLEFVIVRNGENLFVDLENLREDPGIIFCQSIFDFMKTCENRCLFCFVDQMPGGLRETLYVKDDDFRLSFLFGNFVTLNNLSEDEIARIIFQRISPLYVSLHTMNPFLRSMMMGNRAERGIEVLKKIDEAGITTHLQLVLCPGINDADELDDTLGRISEDLNFVESVGCVPVSVSRGRSERIRNYEVDGMEDVIGRVERWQGVFRKKTGKGFVYAADEFYIGAGRELPKASDYDGYPQYENGIGISRTFLKEVESGMKGSPGRNEASSRRVVLVTGKLAGSVVKYSAERLSQYFRAHIDVLEVSNDLFGERVGIAGLLPGRSIEKSLKEVQFDLALIPDCALRDGKFIDDMSVADLQKIFGERVAVTKADGTTLVDQITVFSSIP